MNILRKVERLTNPASGRIAPWIIELAINSMIIIASLGLFAGFGNTTLTNSARWIAFSLMLINFTSEMITAKITYKRKERPYVSFIFNPLVWVELLGIVLLAFPGYMVWAVSIIRLFRLLYLVGTNTIMRITQWVFVHYGQALLDLMVIMFAFTVVVSTAIYAMQVYSGFTAFGGVDTFVDALYYSVVTLSSVGFGDILPLTTGAKVVSFILAIGGVVMIAIVGAIVVTGFVKGFETFREIEATSSGNKSKVMAMKIEIEAYKLQNKYADRLNKIFKLLRINKRIRKIKLSKHVNDIESFIMSHQEATKEISLNEILDAGKTATIETLDEKMNQILRGTTTSFEKASLGGISKNFKLPVYNGAADKESIFELYENGKAGRWTLLMFYGKDFSDITEAELQSINDSCEQFISKGLAVIAVSTQSIKSHKAWSSDSLGFMKYNMGYDKNGELGNYFDVLDYKTGLNISATILIDPDGKIWSINALIGKTQRRARDFIYLVDSTKEAYDKEN